MGTLRIAAGLSALLLLSGCAVETEPSAVDRGPVATPSAEPKPEQIVDSTVTTAVIFGSRIEWRNAAGVAIDSITFDSQLNDFVSKATSYFGPAADEHHNESCTSVVYGDSSQVDGDSLEVLHKPGGKIQLRTESSAINGIRIQTPGGLSVGDDAAALIASTAPELKGEMGTTLNGEPYWSLVYDAVGTWTEHTHYSAVYGAGAWVEDGLLTTIIFPAGVGTLYLSC